MSNFITQQNSRKIGIVIGAAAVIGLGCLMYRKIKKRLQPRILCCGCVTDEDIDALLMQASEYDDWGDEYE